MSDRTVPPTHTDFGTPVWELDKFIIHAVAESPIPIWIRRSGGTQRYVVLEGGLDEAEKFGQAILSAVETVRRERHDDPYKVPEVR